MMLREILASYDQYGISTGWNEFFEKEAEMPYFKELDEFVTAEYNSHTVYPAKENIFKAFSMGPDDIRCIICGQDPYYREGQATGLAFAVKEGIKPPPSLQNIMKELSDDLGEETQSDLENWASQGVFLINSTLTVRDGEPLSHQNKGWETLTAAAIEYVLVNSAYPVAGILWGSKAQSFSKLFTSVGNAPRFTVKSVHPSPLSAYRGFFGSNPFSRVNAFLEQFGESPIKWGDKEITLY